VTLRDPVDRAYSHYQMVTSADGTPAQRAARGTAWRGMTFGAVLRRELAALASLGLVVARAEGGDAPVYVPAPEAQEEDAYTAHQASIPMGSGSHSLLLRGMYELQLRRWFRAFPPPKGGAYDREAFLILKTEDMAVPGGTAAAMAAACRHVGIPEVELGEEEEVRENAREYDPIQKEDRDLLRRFFAPYNRRLGALLGGKGPWEGDVWDYETGDACTR